MTRLIEGDTPVEIAAALKLPLSRVATWLQRGKRELVAALDRHNERERREASARGLAGVLPILKPESLFEKGLYDVQVPESVKARVWERLKLSVHGGGGDRGHDPDA